MSVTGFDIVEGGFGYLDGDLIPEGGGGSDASARFEVDSSGAIVDTFFGDVSGHGGNFTADPFVNIFFPSTRFNQTSSITRVQIIDSGSYYADGDLMAQSTTGSGFFASFLTSLDGRIGNVSIANHDHGFGYADGQVQIRAVYAGTDLV